MGKFEWDSSDTAWQEMQHRMRVEDGEAVERTNPLPFPIYQIQRPMAENKWRKYADRTIYRFQGDLRTENQVSNTGFESVHLVRSEWWKKQMVQTIWSDLGDVSTTDLPGYLRIIPVSNLSVLSKAIGLAQNGVISDRRLPRKNQKGQMVYKHHRVWGMKPEEFYWASAIVNIFRDKEDGPGIESIEFQAVVQLKPWHFRKLAEAIDTFRQTKGRRWDISGVPFTMHDVQPPKNMPTTTTQMKIHLQEENYEVYEPDKFRDFSFGDVAESIHLHLEKWLNDHEAPIKDYPGEGDYPGGWSSDISLYEHQYMDYLHKKETGFEDNDPPFEQDRWSGKSDEDLEALMAEFDIPVPRGKNKTRAKMIDLIEKAQSRL